MTFKIDSVGFYKNRKGEKVEIVNYRVSHGVWEDSKGNPYSEEGFKIFFGEDIISKWVETPEPRIDITFGGFDILKTPVVGMCDDGVIREINKPELEDFAKPSTEKPIGAHGEQKFYLVFNPQQSAPTRQHKTLEEAKKEAKRIAAKHPKQKVYVLETVACYTASVDVQEVGVV